jgi:hypothetical protein
MNYNELSNRELDALVAEKIMGAEITRTTIVTGEFGNEMVIAEDPHYSTDISAAWEVVEKLNPTLFLSISWAEGYEVSCYDPTANMSVLLAVSDSAPRAICLAALEGYYND